MLSKTITVLTLTFFTWHNIILVHPCFCNDKIAFILRLTSILLCLGPTFSMSLSWGSLGLIHWLNYYVLLQQTFTINISSTY